MATTPGNSVNEQTTGISGFTGTAFVGTAVVNHAVIVGGSTSSTLTNVGPTATAGQVLQSAGAAADPVFSTATYPATATGTGAILRADGTNWAATTSTYPNTNAVSTLLYASSANVMAALATANSGVLSTSTSGVPSIDTTNFHVLTTGVQVKGNNTNTAPPSGFIGEQIRATVASGSAVTLSTGVIANITSISLTAGIWDVSGVVCFNGAITGTLFVGSIVTTSATNGTAGDNQSLTPYPPTTGGNDTTVVIPSYRLTLSSTTTVYLTADAVFTVGTLKSYGRISGTRVG